MAAVFFQPGWCATMTPSQLSIILYTKLLTPWRVAAKTRHPCTHLTPRVPQEKKSTPCSNTAYKLSHAMRVSEVRDRIHNRVLRFTPAASYLTDAFFLSALDRIQGSHQMWENLLQGSSRLCHQSCIHIIHMFTTNIIILNTCQERCTECSGGSWQGSAWLG